MNLRETMDNFLLTLSETSILIYKSKIDVFYDFLVIEKGINDKSYQSYLEAMKIDEIQESLNYYIVSNKINSESIAWSFISVVKRYFDFIYTLGIKNVNLLKAFGLSINNPDSFQYKLREKIFSDSRLEKKDAKAEISWEEAKMLIGECDQRMKELTQEDSILNYKTYAYKYNDYMSSLIIKLMLFIGLPYREVINVQCRKRCDIINNTLSINGYCFHLPNKLSEQLCFYEEMRNKVETSKEENDILFVLAKGTTLNKQTNIVSQTLMEYMGRQDVTGVTKFSIIQMIQKGINQSIIQDLTKIGKDIYDYCQEKVNDNKNSSVSRYLDSKLRSLDIFDIL